MIKSYVSSGSIRSPESSIEMAQKVRPNPSFHRTLRDKSRNAGEFNVKYHEDIPRLLSLRESPF